MPSERRPRRLPGPKARIAAWISAPALVLGGVLLLGRGGAPPPPLPSVEATPEPTSAPARTEPSPRSPSTAASNARTGGLPPDIARVIESGSKEPLIPRELNVEVQVAPRGKLTSEPLIPKELDLPELIPGDRGGPLTTEPLVPRTLEVPAK